mmetsp:Transcript_57029/g.134283  ORF Transcript_57029/g.134283 Transcript_57029/m.134283 type:complete len:533 (+) Transcript_57029:2313-3911(+)
MRGIRGPVRALVELGHVDELRELALVQVVGLFAALEVLADEDDLLHHGVDLRVVDLVVLAVAVNHALDHRVPNVLLAHLLEHLAELAHSILHVLLDVLTKNPLEHRLHVLALRLLLLLVRVRDLLQLLLNRFLDLVHLFRLELFDKGKTSLLALQLLVLLTLLLVLVVRLPLLLEIRPQFLVLEVVFVELLRIRFLASQGVQLLDLVVLLLGAQLSNLVAVVDADERQQLAQPGHPVQFLLHLLRRNLAQLQQHKRVLTLPICPVLNGFSVQLKHDLALNLPVLRLQLTELLVGDPAGSDLVIGVQRAEVPIHAPHLEVLRHAIVEWEHELLAAWLRVHVLGVIRPDGVVEGVQRVLVQDVLVVVHAPERLVIGIVHHLGALRHVLEAQHHVRIDGSPHIHLGQMLGADHGDLHHLSVLFGRVHLATFLVLEELLGDLLGDGVLLQEVLEHRREVRAFLLRLHRRGHAVQDQQRPQQHRDAERIDERRDHRPPERGCVRVVDGANDAGVAPQPLAVDAEVVARVRVKHDPRR